MEFISLLSFLYYYFPTFWQEGKGAVFCIFHTTYNDTTIDQCHYPFVTFNILVCLEIDDVGLGSCVLCVLCVTMVEGRICPAMTWWLQERDGTEP